MYLKIMRPAQFTNWLLMACDLQDPPQWTMFLLNHGPETERFRFESAAQEETNGRVSLIPNRRHCKRGICAFEYHWQDDEKAILEHATRTSLALKVELQQAEADPSPEDGNKRSERTVA